ncbi:MAG: hypothetical protein WA116_00960 [Anaerolineaceae bacterium]
MTRPIIPPRYVNIPAGLVYDTSLSPAVRDTYIQLKGLSWGKDKLDEIPIKQIMEVTGKSRATIYGHLAILRASGWLQFSSAHHSGLTCRFTEPTVAHDQAVKGDIVSENLDSLNDDVKESFNSLHHLSNESFNYPATVQKSGQQSKNLDCSNGYHDLIDANLEEKLSRVGLYPDILGKVADIARRDGWDQEHLNLLADGILQDIGPGNGPGIFLWRLERGKKPITEKDRAVNELEKYRNLSREQREGA